MIARARRLFCFSAPVSLVLTSALGMARNAPSQSRTDMARQDPAAILARAKNVMGFSRTANRVVHYHAAAAEEQNYQSDRTYPPFFSAMEVKEGWFDPLSGLERVSTQTTFPGSGSPAQVSITDARRAFALAKERLTAMPRTLLQSRFLNPWNVVADWVGAGDARFAGREQYRDYPRIVLTRATIAGEQRLLVDPKTGFPVKLDFLEKHYLWGQRHVEYLYSTWIRAADIMVPGSSFMLADGKTEISQTFGDVEMIARDSAPSLSLPAAPADSTDALPLFLQPVDLKVSQVGPKTYLLSNPGYTEAVTEIGNEVFLLDATQGEERGRKDAEAIARLFPGKHNVTVVITDLAWPHVAGLRYWVASGATIIAHKAAREFLQSVVDRRWIASPDLLEQHRKTARLRFVGVDARYSLSGGAISLHPIDGIGSEVALMAYLAGDRFLWASDYIQTVAEPTAYALEVWRAAERDGLSPERTAAEHLPLTPWSRIDELRKQAEAAGSGGSK